MAPWQILNAVLCLMQLECNREPVQSVLPYTNKYRTRSRFGVTEGQCDANLYFYQRICDCVSLEAITKMEREWETARTNGLPPNFRLNCSNIAGFTSTNQASSVQSGVTGTQGVGLATGTPNGVTGTQSVGLPTGTPSGVTGTQGVGLAIGTPSGVTGTQSVGLATRTPNTNTVVASTSGVSSQLPNINSNNQAIDLSGLSIETLLTLQALNSPANPSASAVNTQFLRTGFSPNRLINPFQSRFINNQHTTPQFSFSVNPPLIHNMVPIHSNLPTAPLFRTNFVTEQHSATFPTVNNIPMVPPMNTALLAANRPNLFPLSGVPPFASKQMPTRPTVIDSSAISKLDKMKFVIKLNNLTPEQLVPFIQGLGDADIIPLFKEMNVVQRYHMYKILTVPQQTALKLANVDLSFMKTKPASTSPTEAVNAFKPLLTQAQYESILASIDSKSTDIFVPPATSPHLGSPETPTNNVNTQQTGGIETDLPKDLPNLLPGLTGQDAALFNTPVPTLPSLPSIPSLPTETAERVTPDTSVDQPGVIGQDSQNPSNSLDPTNVPNASPIDESEFVASFEYAKTEENPSRDSEVLPDSLCNQCTEEYGACHLPHPSSCEKFVICEPRTEKTLRPRVIKCNKGLSWDRISKNCVSSFQVQCPHPVKLSDLPSPEVVTAVEIMKQGTQTGQSEMGHMLMDAIVELENKPKTFSSEGPSPPDKSITGGSLESFIN